MSTPRDAAVARTSDAESLLFHVLLWVAGADGDIAPEEVEVFLSMMSRTAWCESAITRALAPRTGAQHSTLWKAHASERPSLEPIARGLRAALAGQPEAERAALGRDVQKLANAIARAAGGFLGLGAVSFHEQSALRALSSAVTEALGRANEPEKSMSIAPPPPGAPRWRQGRIALRCVGVRDETHDVKTFRFVAADDPAVRFEYLPGQFVTFELAIDGKTVLRSYSLSSSPSIDDALEVTIKRVPLGLVSNWVHEHLREGDRVTIRGPAGRFSCAPEPAQKLLFLSAGSGVTPVMSMTRWMRDHGMLGAAGRDVVFLHSARTLDDVPFLDELCAIEREFAAFRLVLALTRVGPREAHRGPLGRLNEAMLVAHVPEFRRRTVYVCGPTPFMETTRETLAALGFPMERYFAESFGGAAPRASDGLSPGVRTRTKSLADLLPTPEVQPVGTRESGPGRVSLRTTLPGERAEAGREVVFAQSGRAVGLDDESSLLELAEQVGVRIANACREGVCGSCKVRTIEGHDALELGCHDGLEPAERADGCVLACTAKARARVVLDA